MKTAKSRGRGVGRAVLIDDINVADFSDKTVKRRVQFHWKYFVVVKGIALAISDFFLLVSITAGYAKHQDVQEQLSGVKSSPRIPINSTALFCLYLFAILTSWAMFAYEYRVARRIVESRNVIRAFTNILAYRMYSLKSFAHSCFFERISESRTWSGRIAMWVYFKLQAWRRIFVAQLLLTANRVVIFVNIAYTGPRITGMGALASAVARITSTGDPAERVFRLAVLLVALLMIIDWAVSLVCFVVASAAWAALRVRIGRRLRRYCETKIARRVRRCLDRGAGDTRSLCSDTRSVHTALVSV